METLIVERRRRRRGRAGSGAEFPAYPRISSSPLAWKWFKTQVPGLLEGDWFRPVLYNYSDPLNDDREIKLGMKQNVRGVF